jgi:hypothetical protein
MGKLGGLVFPFYICFCVDADIGSDNIRGRVGSLQEEAGNKTSKDDNLITQNAANGTLTLGLVDSNGDLIEFTTDVAVTAEKLEATEEDGKKVKTTTTKILEDTTQDPRDIEDTTEASGEELYEEVEIEEVILTTPRPSNIRAVENKICRRLFCFLR